jgi:hypothetical protein
MDTQNLKNKIANIIFSNPKILISFKISKDISEEILKMVSDELDEKFPNKNLGKIIKHLSE